MQIFLILSIYPACTYLCFIKQTAPTITATKNTAPATRPAIRATFDVEEEPEGEGFVFSWWGESVSAGREGSVSVEVGESVLPGCEAAKYNGIYTLKLKHRLLWLQK